MAKEMKQGFSLTELLIVGILILILVLFAYMSAISLTAKARDAKRRSDVQLMTKALHVLYEESGTFPECTVNSGTPAWNICLKDLNFVAEDPINTEPFFYQYDGNSAIPILKAYLEKKNNFDILYDDNVRKFYIEATLQ